MALSDPWAPGVKQPTLGKGEVHIWRARLDLAATLPQIRSTLSPDEIARADRFHFSKDRNRFIAARLILRDLLSRYSGVACDELTFNYSNEGKPRLAPETASTGIEFNLSHSNGWAAFALASRRQVGMDIELIRPEVATDEIAERYFSQAEIAELRNLSAEKRAAAFFLCWTRKEAYLKAVGRGLQVPLDSFDVSLTPDKPAQLRTEDSFRWEMHSFVPAENFAGALVVEGEHAKLHFYDWAP